MRRTDDYADGYRTGLHGDAYDPNRLARDRYRDGLREGRAARVDAELSAIYGTDLDTERPPQ